MTEGAERRFFGAKLLRMTGKETQNDKGGVLGMTGGYL